MLSFEQPQAGSPAPQLIVGRDRDSHWVVVETHGLCGGIFVTAEAALLYARSEANRRAGAVRLADAVISFAVSPATEAH